MKYLIDIINWISKLFRLDSRLHDKRTHIDMSVISELKIKSNENGRLSIDSNDFFKQSDVQEMIKELMDSNPYKRLVK